MVTRALELDEYKKIIGLLNTGFVMEGNKMFRKNIPISLALQIQANCGLRIGDTLKLRVNSFRDGKIETREEKTKKLQYRTINPNIYNLVKDYCIDNSLGNNDGLFKIKVRVVQNQLKLICGYLGLENISTHSFRKMYGTYAYEISNNNIYIVKELLNHTSIATTQKYIRVNREQVNRASQAIDFV